MVLRATWMGMCGVLVLGSIVCRVEGEVSALPAGQPPEARAAASFLHCVEASGSRCVTGQVSGGWDAFSILSWLATGAPGQISRGLSERLRRHREPAMLGDDFVADVDRYAMSLRGAGCVPGVAQELTEIVQRAALKATDRLRGFGMWDLGMDGVVAGLVEEVEEHLGHAKLVHFRCEYDPFTLYVAAVELDGRFSAVGMKTLLDPMLGGMPLTASQVEIRLKSPALGLAKTAVPIADGSVDPWLPFPAEEF